VRFEFRKSFIKDRGRKIAAARRSFMLRWFASFTVVGLAVFAVGCASLLSPSSPTVTSIVVGGSAPARGSTSAFTATATMSDGTTQVVTSLATWGSSSVAIATVATTGTVTGVADGTATISATYQGVIGSIPILIGG
jgi:hypothetical protein